MRARWIVLALAACGNAAAPSGSHARDDVLAMWKSGGLETSAFTPATTPVGKDCASGTVAKVDVLICAYASSDEAKQAADDGLQWVGNTTGSSQARGTLVIAVADRRHADPHGRTVNKIFKLVPQ